MDMPFTLKTKPTIKAVVFDLDGTAIPNRYDGVPSARLIKAVQEAKQYVKVSAATGRPFGMCRHILELLQLTSPCIVDGGAELIAMPSEDLLYRKTIPGRVVGDIMKILAPYDFPIYFDETDPIVHDANRSYEEVNKIVLLEAPPDLAHKLVSQLAAITDIGAHLVNAWVPDKQDIHITHAEATKKTAVLKLLELLDIRREEVMAIGDSGNDLPLFEAAGLRLAMGNASDALKAKADRILPTVEEDGLALAIEEYILS